AVVRVFNEQLAATETDAVAGRGLAGECDVRLVDDEPGFEVDRAGDAEDDGAMGFADGVAKRAGAVIGEGGDLVDLASASALGAGAEAFGAGERWERGGERGRGDGGDDEEKERAGRE